MTIPNIATFDHGTCKAGIPTMSSQQFMHWLLCCGGALGVDNNDLPPQGAEGVFRVGLQEAGPQGRWAHGALNPTLFHSDETTNVGKKEVVKIAELRKNQPG